MSANRRQRNSGLAMMVAVVMIAMVAMALLALAARFATEAKMTRYTVRDMQLRQLLLAGAAVGAERLNQPEAPADNQRVTIALPADADGEIPTMTLCFEAPGADGSRRLLIEATLVERHSSQELRFDQRDQRWRVTEAHDGMGR